MWLFSLPQNNTTCLGFLSFYSIHLSINFLAKKNRKKILVIFSGSSAVSYNFDYFSIDFCHNFLWFCSFVRSGNLYSPSLHMQQRSIYRLLVNEEEKPAAQWNPELRRTLWPFLRNGVELVDIARSWSAWSCWFCIAHQDVKSRTLGYSMQAEALLRNFILLQYICKFLMVITCRWFWGTDFTHCDTKCY